MPPPKLIPDNMQAEVLERAGRGETGEQIAAWLTEALGREVSKQRVNELLARIRKERAPIAQAVVAAKVAETAGRDLDAVEQLVQRARAAEDRARRLEAVAMAEPLTGEELGKLDDGVERQLPPDRNGQPVTVDPELAIKALDQQRKERAEQARLAELRLKLTGAGDGEGDTLQGTVVILPPEVPIP